LSPFASVVARLREQGKPRWGNRIHGRDED
jgi:hypothetical protein